MSGGKDSLDPIFIGKRLSFGGAFGEKDEGRFLDGPLSGDWAVMKGVADGGLQALFLSWPSIPYKFLICFILSLCISLAANFVTGRPFKGRAALLLFVFVGSLRTEF